MADGAIEVERGSERRRWRNRCPHAGLPLSAEDGALLVQEGRYLVCPAHGASFDLWSGLCVGGPCAGARLAAAENPGAEAA